MQKVLRLRRVCVSSNFALETDDLDINDLGGGGDLKKINFGDQRRVIRQLQDLKADLRMHRAHRFDVWLW